jgi:hypothetical protein
VRYPMAESRSRFGRSAPSSPQGYGIPATSLANSSESKMRSHPTRLQRVALQGTRLVDGRDPRIADKRAIFSDKYTGLASP